MMYTAIHYPKGAIKADSEELIRVDKRVISVDVDAEGDVYIVFKGGALFLTVWKEQNAYVRCFAGKKGLEKYLACNVPQGVKIHRN
jgi:hypothetical protein